MSLCLVIAVVVVAVAVAVGVVGVAVVAVVVAVDVGRNNKKARKSFFGCFFIRWNRKKNEFSSIPIGAIFLVYVLITWTSLKKNRLELVFVMKCELFPKAQVGGFESRRRKYD